MKTNNSSKLTIKHVINNNSTRHYSSEELDKIVKTYMRNKLAEEILKTANLEQSYDNQTGNYEYTMSIWVGSQEFKYIEMPNLMPENILQILTDKTITIKNPTDLLEV